MDTKPLATLPAYNFEPTPVLKDSYYFKLPTCGQCGGKRFLGDKSCTCCKKLLCVRCAKFRSIRQWKIGIYECSDCYQGVNALLWLKYKPVSNIK